MELAEVNGWVKKLAGVITAWIGGGGYGGKNWSCDTCQTMEALDWVSASKGFVVSCKVVKHFPFVLLRKRRRATLLELLNADRWRGWSSA